MTEIDHKNKDKAIESAKSQIEKHHEKMEEKEEAEASESTETETVEETDSKEDAGQPPEIPEPETGENNGAQKPQEPAGQEKTNDTIPTPPAENNNIDNNVEMEPVNFENQQEMQQQNPD